MLCRKILIITCFVFNLIMCQTFQYQYEFLNNGDVRSMGIGNSDFVTGTSGMISGVNPAKLSYLDNSLEFNLSMESNMERRSIVILDGWGEFLADTDYVFNDHNYFYGSFGFNYKFKTFDKSSFGFGISRNPYLSFDYLYEEEVRAKRDYPEGYVGMKDPIIGYQIFEMDGMNYVNSIGFGYSVVVEDLSTSKPLAIGLGFNFIENFNLKVSAYIDTLHNTFDSNMLDNFDDIVVNEVTVPISDLINAVLSLKIPLGNTVTWHLGLQALYPSFQDFIESIGNGGYDYNEVGLLGLEIHPNYNTLIALQYESGYYYYGNNMKKNKFNIGFEYFPAKRIPIRAGLEYKEHELGDISTLTLGTGIKLNKMNFDIALNYNTVTYYEPNPFAENYFTYDDCDFDCDKVIHNNLFISTSLKWSF